MVKKLLFLPLLFASLMMEAQVPQKIVLEHFTNTRCGICGSRNPGLFTNLEKNKDVIHIAVHPSSPYSNCVLYQHNKTENNARTNYYGILGGTPRIVINGEVQGGGVNFTSSTLFDNFKGKTSPISISVNLVNFSDDSLVTNIVIKTLASHTFSDVTIYVPLVEDSLNYSAPNGEKLHHNVFRKVLLNQNITLPAVGDSLVLSAKTDGNVEWKLDKLRAQVFVQNTTDKKFIQAEKSGKPLLTISSINDLVGPKFVFYPNPAEDALELVLDKNTETVINIITLDGKQLSSVTTAQLNSSINISTLESGIYLISISNKEGTVVKRFVKK